MSLNVLNPLDVFLSPTPDEDLFPAPFQSPKALAQKSLHELEAYYKGIWNSLTDLQKVCLAQHANDMCYSSHDHATELYRARTSPTYSLLRSFFSVVVSCISSVFSDPLAPFSSPSTGFTPFSRMCRFTPLSGRSSWVWEFFGLDKLIEYMSSRWGNCYSPITWANTDMFVDQQPVFDAAIPVLAGQLVDVNPVIELSEAQRTTPQALEFNVDCARLFLLLSTIVYERDNRWVSKASDYPHSAALFLLKSEEKMYCLAKAHGLEFTSISDFQTVSGPFVGAFYRIPEAQSEELPFIIIVVKGTSPDSLAEWIVDSTFTLESATDWLGTGNAHQGFYTSLWPSPSSHFKMMPYRRIVSTILLISQEAHRRTGKKANLWVGGHSLGAGIASLLYARFLESPGDLGKDVVVRDAYCFGTPRACGAELASRFEYNCRKPENAGRTMWRVANRRRSKIIGDVVTQVPPGMADERESRTGLKPGSLLSYGAIGIPIDLTPFRSAPFYKIGQIPVGHEVKVVQSPNQPYRQFQAASWGSRGFSSPINTLDTIFSKMVPIVHDHFPGSYLDSLNTISASPSSNPLHQRPGTWSPTVNHATQASHLSESQD